MSFEEWLGQHGYTPRYDEGGALRGYYDPGGNFLSSSGGGNFDQLQALYQGDQRVDQNGLAGFGTAGYVGQNSPITIGGQTYGQVGDASRDGLTVSYDPTYGNIAPLSQLGPIWQQQAAKTSADNANDLFQYAPLIMGALAMGGIGASEFGLGGLSSPSLIGAEGAAGGGLGSTMTTLEALGGTGGTGNLMNVAADLGAGQGAGYTAGQSIYSMSGGALGGGVDAFAPALAAAGPGYAAGGSIYGLAGGVGGDAINTLAMLDAIGGGVGATAGATALGFPSLQAALASVNPGALAGGALGLGALSQVASTASGANNLANSGNSARNLSDDQYQAQDNESGSRDPGTETNGINRSLSEYLFGSTSAGPGLLGDGTGTGTGGSLLSRLLSGNGNLSDLGSLLGTLGSAGLGYAGAQAQTNALRDMQDRYLALGAPFRSRLASSYEPGFNMATADPAFQGALDQSSNAILRGLSTQGNPYDNPGGLMQAQKYVTQNVALPQLNTYRSQLGSFGQLGTNQAGTAGMGAAQAAGGTYDALGAGLAGLTQPQNDLSSILRQLGGTNGLRLNSGSGF